MYSHADSIDFLNDSELQWKIPVIVVTRGFALNVQPCHWCVTALVVQTFN